MVTRLHPTRPRYPIHCVICTPSFIQLLHASQLFQSQTTKPGREHLSYKLLTLQGSPKKAPGQDLARNGCFLVIPEGTFNCRLASHQRPKIWLQKAPGQDLAQYGCFPMIPEGTCNCRAPSHQSPKIWLQKAPSQDVPQNGCFPMIPEGTFHCRPPKVSKSGSKRLLARIWPKTAVSQ